MIHSRRAGRWLGLWPLANALTPRPSRLSPYSRPPSPPPPPSIAGRLIARHPLGLRFAALGARALTDASYGRNGQLFQMSLRSIWKSPALHPESASLRPVGSLAPKSGSRQLSRSATQWSLRSRCVAECLSSLPVFVGYRDAR